MTVGDFAQIVTDALPYKPNEQQRLVIAALARFCSSQTPSDSVFLLNGYAGTGKTSLTGALVKTLTAVRVPVGFLRLPAVPRKFSASMPGIPPLLYTARFIAVTRCR